MGLKGYEIKKIYSPKLKKSCYNKGIVNKQRNKLISTMSEHNKSMMRKIKKGKRVIVNNRATSVYQAICHP